MKPLKHVFLTATVLLAGVAILALESWQLQQRRRDSKQALAALKKIKQERAVLATQSPAPTGENTRAIEQDLTDAKQVLAELTGVIFPAPSSPVGARMSPTEAYFEIATFIEGMRAWAAAAKVTVKPDEYFSFASHAREGPAAELVPVVLHQRLILEGLLEALLEAHPVALLTVQRQRLMAGAPDNQAAPIRPDQAKQVRAGPGDYFDYPDTLALALPADWHSQSFRLEFSGQTQVLRSFLNKLAGGGQPVFVRSVEVTPIGEEKPGAVSGPVLASAPVPLVAYNLSRFTVIVEAIDLPAT
jgi:hypothetical protein